MQVTDDYPHMILKKQVLARHNNFLIDSINTKMLKSEHKDLPIKQRTEYSTSNCSEINVYTFGKQIGRGAFAIVFEALHKPSKQIVAIKQYDKLKLHDLSRKKQVQREIKILPRLNHTGVVKMFEAFENSNSIYLVMEHVSGESLHQYLKAQTLRRLSSTQTKQIVKQLLNVLMYLHSRCVTHGDIKLENVLVDKKGQIKLLDFGFCRCSSPEAKHNTFCGTPSYMSPEIVCRKNYSS